MTRPASYRSRLIPPLGDVALAVVLALATQAEIWLQPDAALDARLGHAAAFGVATAATAWRRTAPLAASVVVAASLTLHTVLGGPAPVVGGFLAALIVTYSVAANGTSRDAVMGAVVIGLALVTNLVDPAERTMQNAVGNFTVFGVVWALGWGLRRRRDRADEAEARAAHLVERQEAETSAALAAERGRIARELHDVIAHNVSVMVVQAGAARQVLDSDRDAVRAAMLAIEEKGREAMDEMRRLLGILRTEDSELALRPQPGLSDLPKLAADVRRAGLRVDLDVSVNHRQLPAGLELAVYRIVQEALTNTLKHGRATRAHVSVGVDDAVRVSVRDDGRPMHPNGTGHGLAGLRERAAMYGGNLDARPQPDGGFAVEAVLPIAVPQR